MKKYVVFYLSSLLYARAFFSSVRLGNHTLWQVLACGKAF